MKTICEDPFASARQQVYKLLETHCFPRFLKSERKHCECL